MFRRLTAAAIAALAIQPFVAHAEPNREVIEKLIVMGAAYLRCPKGTVSEKSMAQGAIVIQRETGAPKDRALELFLAASQKMADTIKTDQELEAVCKTFVDKLP